MTPLTIGEAVWLGSAAVGGLAGLALGAMRMRGADWPARRRSDRAAHLAAMAGLAAAWVTFLTVWMNQLLGGK